MAEQLFKKYMQHFSNSPREALATTWYEAYGDRDVYTDVMVDLICFGAHSSFGTSDTQLPTKVSIQITFSTGFDVTDWHDLFQQVRKSAGSFLAAQRWCGMACITSALVSTLEECANKIIDIILHWPGNHIFATYAIDPPAEHC